MKQWSSNEAIFNIGKSFLCLLYVTSQLSKLLYILFLIVFYTHLYNMILIFNNSAI